MNDWMEFVRVEKKRCLIGRKYGPIKKKDACMTVGLYTWGNIWEVWAGEGCTADRMIVQMFVCRSSIPRPEVHYAPLWCTKFFSHLSFPQHSSIHQVSLLLHIKYRIAGSYSIDLFDISMAKLKPIYNWEYLINIDSVCT